MKSRSSFEICAPLGIFTAACAFSLPTRIVAIAWIAIGVCTLGYRTLESFPADRIHWKWLRGHRRAYLHFYHLAWWPWYMRNELHEAIVCVRHRFALHRKLLKESTTSERRDNTKHL